MPKLIKASKHVIFNGDGYSDEWHKEAAKRGLPNKRNTIDSLPDLITPKSIGLFGKYGVLTERELHSRYEILLESYRKTINIESQLTAQIARRQILPAALRYQAELATSIGALKAAGVMIPPSQAELLAELVSSITELQSKTAALFRASDDHVEGDSMAHAKHARDGHSSIAPRNRSSSCAR